MYLIFNVFFGIFLSANAYILPTKTILQKTAENAGAGIYVIEQEVQFPNGNDFFTLKETWVIESEHIMRLTVSSNKDQKPQTQMQFVYVGGQRYELESGVKTNKKISADFLEKYLNIRSSEQWVQALTQLQIIPTGALNKKKDKDFKYEPESFVRLSRVGGVVNYAFGEPAAANDETKTPGVWIEQDQFLLRKIRLPSQVEMTAENYAPFARGLYYPRARTIRWGTNNVNVRLISVTTKTGNTQSFTPSSLDISTKTDGLQSLPAKEAILEFYSRFR